MLKKSRIKYCYNVFTNLSVGVQLLFGTIPLTIITVTAIAVTATLRVQIAIAGPILIGLTSAVILVPYVTKALRFVTAYISYDVLRAINYVKCNGQSLHTTDDKRYVELMENVSAHGYNELADAMIYFDSWYKVQGVANVYRKFINDHTEATLHIGWADEKWFVTIKDYEKDTDIQIGGNNGLS